MCSYSQAPSLPERLQSPRGPSPMLLYRLSGLALLLGALCQIAGDLLHIPLGHLGPDFVNPLWVPTHGLFILSNLLIPVGVVGLYVKQAQRLGWSGFVGFVLTFVAIGLLQGAIAYEAFVVPTLALHAPGQPFFINGTPIPLGPLGVVFQIGAVLDALGLLVFGVTMFRAAIFPRWPALLLALFPLAFVGSVAVPALASYLMLVSNIGYSWFGVLLMRETE